MKKSMMILVAIATLGVSGCATMSSDECLTSDWQAIGYEDGSRGYTADRLGNHRKACAKHGVTPDFQAYQTGHEQGLNNFCQPSRGFNLGVNGGSYNGVCANHREHAFVDAYNAGHHLYRLRSDVNSANNSIHYKESELEKNEDRMRSREAALIASETSTEDRILILADLKDLAEENGELEAEIRQLIEERAESEHRLADYEASLAELGY